MEKSCGEDGTAAPLNGILAPQIALGGSSGPQPSSVYGFSNLDFKSKISAQLALKESLKMEMVILKSMCAIQNYTCKTIEEYE